MSLTSVALEFQTLYPPTPTVAENISLGACVCACAHSSCFPCRCTFCRPLSLFFSPPASLPLSSRQDVEASTWSSSHFPAVCQPPSPPRCAVCPLQAPAAIQCCCAACCPWHLRKQEASSFYFNQLTAKYQANYHRIPAVRAQTEHRLTRQVYFYLIWWNLSAGCSNAGCAFKGTFLFLKPPLPSAQQTPS